MEKLKVYCLPYAGGTKTAYSDWVNEYSDIAEIIPVEYNGHGERFCEPFYENAEEAANDICQRIMAEKPVYYAIYGHSFGSMIAVLAAEQLEKKYDKKPLAVIIGGMRPMHLKYKDKKLYHLPKEELMKEIYDLGQTSEEIMNEPELVDLIYEIIHNDLRVDETFVYDKEAHQKLTIPMVVMTGTEDIESPFEDMKEWQNYTNGSFTIKEFPSGHFFPFQYDGFSAYFFSVLKKITIRLL